MAKANRFPSPANVAVDKKTGKPLAPKSDPVDKFSGKPVSGKKVDLVEVEYSGENHLVLHNGVHAIVKGLNHVSREIMDEAAKHPSIAALIKAGKIVIGGKKAAKPSAAEPAKEESAEAPAQDESAPEASE
jgi:hypothetical protein